MSVPGQVIVQQTGVNVIEVITQGPQGPTGPIGAGPTGPTGPSGGGGGGGAIGQQSLSVRAVFQNVIAALNPPLIADYTFGTNAATGSGITPITNQTQLANYFNPFEDFTELTSINSEIERYQPFNSTNHAFSTNALTLQAVNPNSDWNCTAVTQLTGATVYGDNATPNSIANLGLANTSSIQIGQMCAAQGGGIGGNYWVTAIVANTSVTLQALNGSPTTTASSGLMFWLPVVGVKLSSPYTNGQTTMTFASLPAFVQIGMALGVYNSPLSGVTLNRSADWRISNIVGSVITFGPVVAALPNLGTGTIIWFLPVVTSGQIWSQLQLDITNPQTFFAFQVDATVLNSVTTLTNLGNSGQITLAQFNAFPSSTPFGGWPAFWWYSADDGNSSAETSSASEIDCVEIQVGCTQDIRAMNAGNAGFPTQAIVLGKNDSGWTYNASFGISTLPMGSTFVGRNLYQFIFCNGYTYRFFNGLLYNAKTFQWANQRPAQFSVGIATGGLTAALTANTIFPNNAAGFADIQVAIHGIEVWYQAAPGGG